GRSRTAGRPGPLWNGPPAWGPVPCPGGPMRTAGRRTPAPAALQAGEAARRAVNALLGERPPRRQAPRLGGITGGMPLLNSNNDDTSWRHELDAPGWYGPDIDSPAPGDQGDEPIATPTYPSGEPRRGLSCGLADNSSGLGIPGHPQAAVPPPPRSSL